MKPENHTEPQRLLPGCNPNGEERRFFPIADILAFVQAMFHDFMSFEKKKFNADGLLTRNRSIFESNILTYPEVLFTIDKLCILEQTVEADTPPVSISK